MQKSNLFGYFLLFYRSLYISNLTALQKFIVQSILAIWEHYKIILEDDQAYLSSHVSKDKQILPAWFIERKKIKRDVRKGKLLCFLVFNNLKLCNFQAHWIRITHRINTERKVRNKNMENLTENLPQNKN